MTTPKCRLCDKDATTTAGHYPVCRKHFAAYTKEGAKYLPVRPVWEAIQKGK